MTEDPKRPYAIRARRSMLDGRAQTIHKQRKPSHAGTKHLGRAYFDLAESVVSVGFIGRGGVS